MAKGQVAAVYNVLIVDDEDKILNGLTRLISWDDYGLEIIGVAHDGQEAWDILARSECSILITDIRMPRMDGIALLQRISEASMGVRAIVISGYDDFAYVKKALLLGIENYLLKPINEDELSATLLTILDKLDHETKARQIRQYGADILMDNVIYRWATESIEWEELESRAELLDVDLTAKAYLAVVVRLAAGGGPANEAARQIRTALSSALAPDYSIYSAVTPGSELILLVASHCEPSIPLIRRQIGFALNALSQAQGQTRAQTRAQSQPLAQAWAQAQPLAQTQVHALSPQQAQLQVQAQDIVAGGGV